MKEICLWIEFKGTDFQVHRDLNEAVEYSVFIVDLSYTPWIRENGNILW